MSNEIKIPVKLFVSKFPQTLSEESLREVCLYDFTLSHCLKIFAVFGEIESLVILKSKDPTRTQGCGFVRFASVSDAARAIHELNGKHVIDSVRIHLMSEYMFFRRK